jgi:O-antigen ligase
VLLFCVLINLFFTYSRGGWVAFILVNMLILMLFPEKKTRAISLSLLFIFTLGIFTIPNIRERFILIFQAGGDADRFRVWRAAFAMFRDSNFLIGKGVGTFMAHFRTYAKAHTQYAHNCYLQILAESGILGLLSFLWLLGELFLAGYKKLKRKFDYLFLGVFSAFIALSIHIFFDTQLYSTKLAILFWVIVSFVAVYLQESDNSQSLS